jgi:hypothetical protein
MKIKTLIDIEELGPARMLGEARSCIASLQAARSDRELASRAFASLCLFAESVIAFARAHHTEEVDVVLSYIERELARIERAQALTLSETYIEQATARLVQGVSTLERHPARWAKGIEVALTDVDAFDIDPTDERISQTLRGRLEAFVPALALDDKSRPWPMTHLHVDFGAWTTSHVFFMESPLPLKLKHVYKLTSLTLESFPLNLEGLDQALEYHGIANVTHLILSNPRWADSIQDRVTRLLGRRDFQARHYLLLEHLTRFTTLIIEGNGVFTDDRITGALSAFTAWPTLREITLIAHEPKDSEVPEALERLRFHNRHLERLFLGFPSGWCERLREKNEGRYVITCQEEV